MAALLDGPRVSQQPRLRMACDACHETKTRCSGGVVCESCEDLAVPCIYSVAKPIGRPPGSRNKKHKKLGRKPHSETRPLMDTTAAATDTYIIRDAEDVSLSSEAVSVVTCPAPGSASLSSSPLHGNIESITSSLPSNLFDSGCEPHSSKSGSDPRELETPACTCLDRFMDLLGRLRPATNNDSCTRLEMILQGVRQFHEEWVTFQLCHHCHEYPDPDILLLMMACIRLPLRQLKRSWIRMPGGDQLLVVEQATPLHPTFLGTYQMTAEEEDVVTNVLLKRALVVLQGILVELRTRLDRQEINASLSDWYNGTAKLGANADAFPCPNHISPSIYGVPSPPTPTWTGSYRLQNVDRDENSIAMESNDFTPLQQMVALAIRECQNLAAFTGN